MPDISTTCPSCSGSLQIPNDIERFACAHCGKEHTVKRRGGIITLEPVVQEIKKIDEPAIEVQQPTQIKRKKPVMGILSCVFTGISLCGIGWILYFIYGLNIPTGDYEQGAGQTFLVLVAIAGTILSSIPGLIFGIIGVFQKKSNRIPAIIGTTGNGLIVFGFILSVLIIYSRLKQPIGL
jgi:hypothetical protein